MYVQIFVTWYACTLKIMYIMNYVHTLNFFQNLWTNFNIKHKAYLIYSKLLSFNVSNSSL